MKLIRTLLLLTLPLAATGCFQEDYSMCTAPYNVILDFTQPNESGVCEFGKNVSSVDMALFNSAGTCYKLYNFNASQLSEHKGAKLNLEPGTYHVACWGNTGTNTRHYGIEEGNAATSAYVTYRNVINGIADNCDAVYYTPAGPHTRGGIDGGQFTMIVPAEGYNGTIEFAPAYRQLEIVVQGYDYNGNTQPKVKISGLGEGVDFFDRTPIKDGSGNPKTIASVQNTSLTTIKNKPSALAQFRAFWFEPDNGITIDILNPQTGELVWTEPLKAHMINMENPNRVTVTVIFEFKATGVSVSIPNWNINDVYPGFWD